MQRAIERLDLWRSLLQPESAPLLQAVRSGDIEDAAHLARLRATWHPELIAVASELVRARRKAAVKFPSHETIVADVEGIEQATAMEVALRKARRFASIGARSIVDLCCGIGGDAMALARAASVRGIDSSPLRAWMCAVNASCETRCADVTGLALADEIYHLDPARRRRDDRTGRMRRLHQFDDYLPGPAFIASLRDRCPTGAIKLGPGIDFDSLDATGRAEVEIINHRGTLVQTVLWTGELAFQTGLRTATRLPEGQSFSAQPRELANETAEREFGSHLLISDPALERAKLVAALLDEGAINATEIWPGLGLLTSELPVQSPWLTCFEICDVLPWRIAKIRERLRALDGHVAEIRTRGRAIDPDQVRGQFANEGGAPFTLFGLRLGRRVVAVIARLVDSN